ncbi:hypothetical protein QFE97_04310 [Bacillus subtilis]|nr:hypothetical protein QFE97_04310 [Bacillus subtilis]
MFRKLLAGLAAVVVASSTATAAHAAPQSSDTSAPDMNGWEVTINGKVFEPDTVEGEDRSRDKASGVDTQLNPITIGLCNMGAKDKVIQSFKSTKDGDVDLKCGTSSDGYIHIREEHEDQWEDQKKDWPGYWDDLMVQAVQDSVEDGHVAISQKGNKRCYAGTVQIKFKGKVVNTFHPSTIVSKNNKKIITSIPTNEHRCVP